MERAYLQEFSDGNLRRRLFVKENVPLLGDILLQQGRRLLQLKKQRLPSAGTGCNSRALTEAYGQIRADVEAFLGVEGMSVPTLETMSLFDGSNGYILRWYGRALVWTGVGAFWGIGGYLWQRRARARGKALSGITRRAFLGGLIPLGIGGAYGSIAIEAHAALRHDGGYNLKRQAISYSPAASQTEAELTIAHEYAHHVQSVMGFRSTPGVNLTVAKEGMARLVDQYIGRLYAKRFRNPAYERDALQKRVWELKAAYLDLCEQVAVTPDATLLRELRTIRTFRPPADIRVLGYALFVILQQQRGDQIHRDILRGTFQWQAGGEGIKAASPTPVK